jgi:hypothetical protein
VAVEAAHEPLEVVLVVASVVPSAADVSGFAECRRRGVAAVATEQPAVASVGPQDVRLATEVGLPGIGVVATVTDPAKVTKTDHVVVVVPAPRVGAMPAGAGQALAPFAPAWPRTGADGHCREFLAGAQLEDGVAQRVRSLAADQGQGGERDGCGLVFVPADVDPQRRGVELVRGGETAKVGLDRLVEDRGDRPW